MKDDQDEGGVPPQAKLISLVAKRREKMTEDEKAALWKTVLDCMSEAGEDMGQEEHDAVIVIARSIKRDPDGKVIGVRYPHWTMGFRRLELTGILFEFMLDFTVMYKNDFLDDDETER